MDPSPPDTISLSIEVEGATAPSDRVLDHMTSIREFSQTPAGSTIGRYVVLGTLGSGGMGTVLRAYDPKLRREVALKRLRPAMADAESEARLVREARALAQLSHPNVVAVYDVDVESGGLIVAMELVRGSTLLEWMKRPHPWRARVDVMLLAGRGLAAAHHANLVHRDFKPANVMINDEGQAKVMDFGLAKPASDHRDDNRASAEHFGSLSGDSLEASVTITTGANMVVGTPPYMAPEQHTGSRAGPAADQYAFCLTLWEVITGQRPFRGSLGALTRAKLDGPPSWPRNVAAPQRIVDTIRRGLAPRPADRWPDMEALIEALADASSRRRTRWWLGLTGLSLATVATVGWRSWTTSHAKRCTGAHAQLEDAWGPQARAQIQQAITSFDTSYAAQAWAQVETRFDRYATQWVQMHTEACEATTIRGELSTEVLDLRMQCLHRARVGLEAISTLLASADATAVERSHQLLEQLPPLSTCDDLHALQGGTDPPRPEDAAAVEEVRARLMETATARAAGRYDIARASMAAAKEQAAALSYGPLRTEVALEEGVVLEFVGEYEASVTAFEQALDLAAEADQWDTMQKAATNLMFVIGYQLKRPDEALRYQQLAQRLTRGDPAARGTATLNLANVLFVQGKYQDAEDEYRRALDLHGSAPEPNRLELATIRGGLANALDRQGKHALAEIEQREALQLHVQALGPDHPRVAITRSNLAIVLEAQGKYEDAEAELVRGLEILRSTQAPDHPQNSTLTMNLANVLHAQGRYRESEVEARRAFAQLGQTPDPTNSDLAKARLILSNSLYSQARYEEAEAELRQAITSMEASLGPRHPLVAMSMGNLALSLQGQHRYEEAEAQLRRTLALAHEVLGTEHPEVASTRSNLGLVLLEQGKHTEAEIELRGALGLKQTLLAHDHPSIAFSRAYLAQLLVDQGRASEALPLAEQAWSRHQRDDIPTEQRAHTAFTLARAQWLTHANRAQREQARALAQRALADYEQDTGNHADHHAEGIAEIRAWLNTHRLR
ncbi:MAG: serine/threonine-protein kinase [Myxococcota bacterium]